MDIEEVDKAGALRLLNEEESLTYFEANLDTHITDFEGLELPEGFQLINTGTNQLARSARSYVRSRGFKPDDMALKGWGYGTSGKYWGYLIIPIYYKNKMVFYTSRRFLGSGPKFLNLGKEESGVGKNLVIYNHEALFIYDKIRIVESIMNAETLGDNTIAINGKMLSPFQFNQIILSPATHVSVLLDNDAWLQSINICLSLVDYKNVKPVYFDDNRDVNDLGRKQTYLKILKHKYLTHRELIKLKNERPILTHNGE